MAGVYQPLHLGEKPDWDNDGDASLEEVGQTDEWRQGNQRRELLRRKLASNCIWIVHAILLSVSTWMFLCALNMQSSTLQHVKDYSAWCKWCTIRFAKKWLNHAPIAPAAAAVDYQTVKYNVTTTNNRYVGAGPEVDKAWREISYDSESQFSPLDHGNRLTSIISGRSDDFASRPLASRYARKLFESGASSHR